MWTIAMPPAKRADFHGFRDVRPLVKRMRDIFGVRALAAALGTDAGNLSSFLSRRRQLSPEIARRAIDLDFVLTRAAQIFEPEVILDWLNGNDPYLDHARPIDVLAIRGAGPLIDALDGHASLGYR